MRNDFVIYADTGSFSHYIFRELKLNKKNKPCRGHWIDLFDMMMMMTVMMTMMMTMMMQICKAPTLRLKVLNKNNIAHIVSIEITHVLIVFSKMLTYNVNINEGSSITM